jgi:hypothetical protein
MVDKTVKSKVAQKLNLAGDIHDAKIQTSISQVKKVDGKISASFEISGLPTKKEGGYSDSYKSIPKIFDTIEKFAEYATTFFNASDDEIIKMCKASYSSDSNSPKVSRY